MTTEKRVRLDRLQFLYLTSCEELIGFVIKMKMLEGSVEQLNMLVEREVAEGLIACLKCRLAECGYDQEHQLTYEGRMIESIIDLMSCSFREDEI